MYRLILALSELSLVNRFFPLPSLTHTRTKYILIGTRSIEIQTIFYTEDERKFKDKDLVRNKIKLELIGF